MYRAKIPTTVVTHVSEKSDNSAKQAENNSEEDLSNEADIDAIWHIVHCPHCHRSRIITKE